MPVLNKDEPQQPTRQREARALTTGHHFETSERMCRLSDASQAIA
jgi:hypothetical protein